MTVRLSHSSFTGTERTLVAVGTVRLMSMFFAVRAGAPRRVRLSGSASAGLRSGGLVSREVRLRSLLGSASARGVTSLVGEVFFAGGLSLFSWLFSDSVAWASWDSVLRDSDCLAPDFLGSAFLGSAFCSGCFFSGFLGSDFCWALLRRRAAVGAAVTALEELRPGLVHAGGVLRVLLVHLVHEPLVRAEVARWLCRCSCLVAWCRLGHAAFASSVPVSWVR